jgi:hypothetical protein
MTPCGSCSQSYTLKMEAIRSSETSVLIRATRRHLPEDDNHQLKIALFSILNTSLTTLNWVGIAVTIQTTIREVHGSNLVRDTD